MDTLRFASEQDLRCYIDGAMGPDATPEIVDRVKSALNERPDRPAYDGGDWRPWLDEIDLWEVERAIELDD